MDLEFDRGMRNKYDKIVGIDEAGRGPLAGPVVSCAVELDENQARILLQEIPFLNDSKKLNRKKHKLIYEYVIKNKIDHAIGISSESEIDIHNILKATCMSMEKAVSKMNIKKHMCIVDGKNLKLKFDNVQIIGGDAQSVSIALASNVAKYVRDTIMIGYSKNYVGYFFDKHKGYGTKKHIESMKNAGIIPLHRLTFKPVYELIKTDILCKWHY